MIATEIQNAKENNKVYCVKREERRGRNKVDRRFVIVVEDPQDERTQGPNGLKVSLSLK